MAQTYDSTHHQPVELSSPVGPSPIPGSQQTDPATSLRELERKYRLRTYQAQELMIEKVLYGRFVNTDTLERKLHMFDIDLPYQNFMTVIVRPFSSTGSSPHPMEMESRNGEQVGLIVSSIFSEVLSGHYICFPANLDDRYAFLLNFDENDVETVSASVAAICRDAVKFMTENFTLSVRVCVSGCCNSLSTMHDLFRETIMVLDDPNTQYHEDVCVRAENVPESPQQPKRPDPSIEKQYLNALVTQDFETALQLTLDRIESISENGPAPLDRIKSFLNLRMRTTNNVLSVPMSDVPAGDSNLGECCMQLETSSSLDEIKATLNVIFDTLDRYYNTTPSSYSGTTGKVVALINKRYMEPDLSVEMICDTLGKSRSYLSRMFKENTGMNLLDYLHSTRLNAAKKLLNETNLGIAEIAAQVGYYSGWTLARVFKRYEGITPTAYRKAFCNTIES